MKIPNDADGDAMRRVLDAGSDPTRPMDIDFLIACSSIPVAEAIAPLADQKGYKIEINQDPEDNSITCYCMKKMLLDYDELIHIQAELDLLAKPHGGYIDGWGTFGNIDNKK